MTPKSRVVDVLAFYGTIINNHKLGSLTEQKLNLSQLWRPEVQKSRHQQGHALSPQALGKNASLFFPASGGFWHSLACGSLTPISASVFTWPSSLSVCLDLNIPLRFYKDTSRWI